MALLGGVGLPVLRFSMRERSLPGTRNLLILGEVFRKSKRRRRIQNSAAAIE